MMESEALSSQITGNVGPALPAYKGEDQSQSQEGACADSEAGGIHNLNYYYYYYWGFWPKVGAELGAFTPTSFLF